MLEKKSNKLYWGFKLVGILISCALPIWAICERFPIWTESHGTGRTVGVGVILIGIVLLVVFRKTVFDFIRDHFDLKHAPPLAIWIVMLIISYILVYIGEFMRDLTSVFWMGFIGCAIGTFFTFLSNRFKKDVTTDE